MSPRSASKISAGNGRRRPQHVVQGYAFDGACRCVTFAVLQDIIPAIHGLVAPSDNIVISRLKFEGIQ
jgi:hypothetical protein